jgi:hypothetical protein
VVNLSWRACGVYTVPRQLTFVLWPGICRISVEGHDSRVRYLQKKSQSPGATMPYKYIDRYTNVCHEERYVHRRGFCGGAMVSGEFGTYSCTSVPVSAA